MISSYLSKLKPIQNWSYKKTVPTQILSALLMGVLLSHLPFAQAKTVEWPADTVQWRPSDLPGYSLALQKCTTCHSAHYAEYQPPSAGAPYWKAQVLRMKAVFKAPISDEEAQSVVDYLSQNYGSARK